MENSFKATSGKGYDSNQNADGTIDICFRQQIMDPAMMVIFIFPIFFATSCSGIFGLENTYGMPGGAITSFLLLVVVSIAGYKAIEFFNSKKTSIKIIPGQGIEFGGRTLANSAIEKIGTQAGNKSGKSCRVYALVGGEKIFITEFTSSAVATAIQSGIQECLKKN